MAHIEGGEVSQGAVDDAVRNALTKLSHLHFTPTESARRRVLAMGEEPWRVHRVGAPSLDHLRKHHGIFLLTGAPGTDLALLDQHTNTGQVRQIAVVRYPRSRKISAGMRASELTVCAWRSTPVRAG